MAGRGPRAKSHVPQPRPAGRAAPDAGSLSCRDHPAGEQAAARRQQGQSAQATPCPAHGPSPCHGSSVAEILGLPETGAQSTRRSPGWKRPWPKRRDTRGLYVARRPDVAWVHALRLQDLAAEHDLGRHARRVEGGRRHRAVRVGLDLRPLLPDLLRQHRPVPGGLDHPDRAGPGDDPPAHGHPGHRHPLSPPGHPGQHGDHPRHRVRRATRARASGPGGTRRSRGPTGSSWARRASAATASRRPAR